MSTQAYPYISFLGILWGINLVVSRFSIGQFDPLLFVGLRLGLASLAFLLVYLFLGRRPLPTGRALWLHASLLGVFGTAVPMSLVIASLQYQSSGITALLITSSPAMIVVLAHLFLPDERLTRLKSTGVLLAVIGASLLIIAGESGLPDVPRASMLGYGMVLMAIFSESSMTIYVRRHMNHLDAFEVTSIRLFIAALVVMPLLLLGGGVDLTRVDERGILSLGYAAFAGAFTAQLLAFYVTKRFGATAFSMANYLVPIVAAVVGAVILGERITTVMVLGMLLTALGIMLINRRDGRAALPSQTRPTRASRP